MCNNLLLFQPIKARVDVHHEHPAPMMTQHPPTMSAINFSHVDNIIQVHQGAYQCLTKSLKQS